MRFRRTVLLDAVQARVREVAESVQMAGGFAARQARLCSLLVRPGSRFVCASCTPIRFG
jgi:hypothetical protein